MEEQLAFPMFPVRTRGDGNCFFNACSRLKFGDQRFSTELRVRCIVEGVLNNSRYLDPNYLCSDGYSMVPSDPLDGNYCTILARITQNEGQRVDYRDDALLAQFYQMEMLRLTKKGAGKLTYCIYLFGQCNTFVLPTPGLHMFFLPGQCDISVLLARGFHLLYFLSGQYFYPGISRPHMLYFLFGQCNILSCQLKAYLPM